MKNFTTTGMETQIISELLKYGGLVGVLGYGLYIMWKRYDKYTERTQAELTALRDEVKKYMNDDRKHMEEVIAANTQTLSRMNDTLSCLMPELIKFKRSNVYKQYENEGH